MRVLELSKQPNPVNIDHIEDETLDLLVADNVLNKLAPAGAGQAVVYWKTKVREGGQMFFRFPDIRRAARIAGVGGMSLETLHKFIFGEDNKNASLWDYEQFSAMCHVLGLKIVSAGYEDNELYAKFTVQK